MIIHWRIHYLDKTDEQRRSRERQYRDRDLFLDTAPLDAVTKAAVEFIVQAKKHGADREILKYRHLFQERDEKEIYTPTMTRSPANVFLHDYTEDETGKELSNREIAVLLTGSPDYVIIPNGAESHDVEFMLSERKPLPVAEVTLTTEQVKLLGYFCRDLRELVGTAFFKEPSPATLKSGGSLPLGESRIETAVTDEEIRSYLTILRRLYMQNEPANFVKSATLFATALGDNPYGRWVLGAAKSYEAKLAKKPSMCFGPFKFNLTRKRLIDVFLYTQYAHQPDDIHKETSQQRERQFAECLKEVGDSHAVLTWLFLSELSQMGGEINSAGKIVSHWFDLYCQHHSLTPDVLKSLLHEHPGIGTLEKEADRRERILGEKAQEVATELWKQAGSPPNGAVHYLHLAHEQLTAALRPEVKESR